jgi:hypothetical protein
MSPRCDRANEMVGAPWMVVAPAVLISVIGVKMGTDRLSKVKLQQAQLKVSILG